MKIAVLRRNEWRNTGIERFESKIVPWLLDHDGFEPIDFSLSNGFPLSGTLSRFHLGRKVRKEVEKKGFDVVFVPSQDLMLNIDPEQIDAQVVPYIHDILTVTTAFTSYFVKILDKKSVYNVEKCQKAVTASNTTADELEERTEFSGSTQTIYQGVDMPKIQDRSYDEREIDVLYIGTLIDRKDPDLVKKVAELAKKRGLNMAAVNYEELDLPCETYENVSDEKLRDLLDDSRFYLHPGFHEGFGRGAVEAQRRGVPVIARDNQINNEILEDFLNLKSPESVVDYIGSVKKWKKLSKESQQNSEKYNWQETREQLLKLLKRQV